MTLLEKIEEIGLELQRRGYTQHVSVEQPVPAGAAWSWALRYTPGHYPAGPSGLLHTTIRAGGYQETTRLSHLGIGDLAKAAERLPELCRKAAAAQARYDNPEAFALQVCDQAWAALSTLHDYSKDAP